MYALYTHDMFYGTEIDGNYFLLKSHHDDKIG